MVEPPEGTILCDLVGFKLTFFPVVPHMTEALENPERYRFQMELEFVQCLANPQYLNCKQYTCTLCHASSIDHRPIIHFRHTKY